MLRKIIAVVVSLVVAGFGVAQAAPVRVPSAVDRETTGVLGEMADGKILLGVGAEYEMVDEVEGDITGGEVEFDTASAIFSATYDNRASLYGTIGQIMDPTIKYTLGGDNVVINLDDELIGGVGFNAALFKDNGFQVFTDISYRETDDLGYVSSTVNGAPGVLLADSLSAKFEEFQVALGASFENETARLYGGVAYSDAEYTGKATLSGTTYTGTVEKDSNVGVFIGTGFTVSEGLEIDIQGRFIDETAFTVSANYKF